MSEKSLERHYLLFIANNPPQTMVSTVDLIAAYEKQIAEMSKSGKWDKPIRFTDEEGEVAAVYPHWAIMGIVRGFVVPDQKPHQPEETH